MSFMSTITKDLHDNLKQERKEWNGMGSSRTWDGWMQSVRPQNHRITESQNHTMV